MMPHGAEMGPDGRIRFRLWAPGCERIEVAIEGGPTLPLERGEEGWHSLSTDAAGTGTLYQFVLPDGMRVPDPASRYQPRDVYGPSEVIDPTGFTWSGEFAGRPWSEAVIYEMHVGAFTDEGTFAAASARLDHLQALGVTAVEIMPVSDFPGGRNWGYDGVLPYAADSSYGRPEDFKSFVREAHARNIMVLLDVVYNHFGPDGNFLPVYAPSFFTDRHKTPWGAGINYDGEHSRPVRDFIIHNALYWLEEYDLDGLRLDAVHAIMDDSEEHLLDELARSVRAMRGDRPTHLVLENEENAASRLKPDGFTAQWNDDVHHVLHVAVTGEDAGYYKEYAGRTDLLARALAEGFAFQGEMMEYRGETRGEASNALPPGCFVAFSQNHDQIGNRAFGDRLAASVAPERLRAVAAIVLLLPQVPMLFMGEEWGATTPFPFFCDFEGDLADAVRQGRRDEFKRFPEFADPAQRDRIPDPLAYSTFRSAKLLWDEIDGERLAATTEILAKRRRHIEPLLAHIMRGGRHDVLGDRAIRVEWDAGDAGRLLLVANLSPGEIDIPPLMPDEDVFHTEGLVTDRLGPWAVRWSRSRA